MGAPSAPGLPPVFAGTVGLKVPVPQKNGRTAELHVEDSGPASASLTCLCLPGLGDLKQQYRFLAPLLKEKGCRVLVADLRGHGNSSADFDSHTPLDISSDIGTILESAKVSGKVVLLGNSLAASSALHYAATHPDTVAGVVGLGPVTRDLPNDGGMRLLSYCLFSLPWGPSLWVSFFDTLFKKHRPEDLKEYKEAVRAKLWEKGRLAAVAQLIRGTKNECYQEAQKVQCPVLLLFGDADPDFSNPAEEAEQVKAALTSSKAVQVELLPGLGHYPHVEDPKKCSDLFSTFLQSCSG